MENIKEKMKNVVTDIEEIIEYIQKNKMENEQSTLDWMDKINKLSVTF